MPRQPLYPHVPKSRISKPPPQTDVKLRFLPDSQEFLAETITCTGCREKLDRAFLQAIARVQGGK